MAVLLIVAVVTAITAHSSYEHVVFVLISGAVAIVVLAVSGVAVACHPEADRWSVPTLRLSSMVLAALVLSLVLGYPMRVMLVNRSKEWCERQVPAIDRYRAERGSYPSSLADVDGVESPPWFCAPVYGQPTCCPDEFYFFVREAPLYQSRWLSNRRTWNAYGAPQTTR